METVEPIVAVKRKYNKKSRAERNVRLEQKSSASTRAIPSSRFAKIIKEIARRDVPDIKFGKAAVRMLQTIVEDTFITKANKAYKCSLHAGRQTLKVEDWTLALLLEG
jgi:histone H3/H4